MEKLTQKEVFALSMDAYNGKSSNEKYSAEERIEGFANYLQDLGQNYRANKDEIFQIIEQTANEILPKRVDDMVKQFAEFKNVDNNTTIKFRVKKGKIKAVEVALGGVVERQRIDNGSFMLETEAIECKVYEEFERVLGGQVDWNSLMNMVLDAIMEAIMKKIYATLVAVYSKLPTSNVHKATNLELSELDKIINVIKAYGKPVIMGTGLGISQIKLDTNASEMDKLDIRNRGYVGMYKGCPVVEIVNSFEDDDNLVKVLDDKYLFILPSGSEKVVKVAMEGGMYLLDTVGKDRTVNFDAYQKVGVGTLAVNNIGMYEISSLV